MLSQEQLLRRQSGIGGSDAAAIVGLDPYRQPADVWAEKVLGTRDETIGDREAVRWGNILEAPIADEWARRHKVKIQQVNDTLFTPEAPHRIAHIDRRVLNSKQGLEVKARGYFASSDYGPSGTDQVKETDIIQCQHYMGVTGWGIWHMAVLVGGQELRSYVIPRDQGLIDSLFAAEDQFWSCVLRETLPAINYEHPSTRALLGRLYPGTNGATVQLPDRAIAIKAELDQLKQIQGAAKKRVSALENEIRDLLGESAVGLLPNGEGGWRRRLVVRGSYEVKASEYFDVRFSSKAR